MTYPMALDCQVQHPIERRKTAVLPALPVNEQSIYTWLPKATLETLGVMGEKEISFVTMNKRRITRRSGFVILRVGKYFTIDEVIFAERRDPCCLGKRSLLGLNLVVEPLKNELQAAPPLLAGTWVGTRKMSGTTSLGIVAEHYPRLS